MGFKLKVEPDRGDLLDDSSLNAVELQCFTRQGQFQGTAASSIGEQGDWKSEQFCGVNHFINAARFRSKAVSDLNIIKSDSNSVFI